MSKFFSTFKDRYPLFAFIFLVSVGGLMITLFSKGTAATVAMSISIGLILFIAKPIWFSDRYGETAIKLMSLGVAGTAVFMFAGWPQLLENYFKPYLKQHYPSIEVQSLDQLAIYVFIFLSFVIYIVNRSWHYQTGMGVHPNSIELDIPEPSFKKKLISVSAALTDEIRNADNNLNWNNLKYIDLDAEILVKSKSGLKRKYGSLLKALKSSDGKLFLLLGSPGAGKSVALRKLCVDLEEEVSKTGKIPVYVNLREWKDDSNHWTDENLPSIEDLDKFIKKNILHRDIVSKRFFESYYDKLYQSGRLFFILDSFDEIPAVLGEKENSLLINHLSKIIFNFLKGARYDYQGVLASRMFRHPTNTFQEDVTLEILSFSDEKVINNFEQEYIEQSIIQEIFSHRNDLLNISRNPFYSSLLFSYISNNKALPDTVAEIFSDYFNKSLIDGTSFIEERGLTVEGVLDAAYSISYIILHDKNIEMTASDLKEKLPSLPIDDILDILEFCRIGRVGNVSKKFSYSHRRLMEYLAIKKIIIEDYAVPYELIPENSQWFDSLSIYCEIAPLDKANEIANFCCSIIENSNSINDIKTKRSLRFLLSAFLNRRICLKRHKDMLEAFFLDQLYKNHDLFSILLVIKSINLLEDKALNIVRPSLYILNNHIVSIELIKAIRVIKPIPDYFIEDIKDFVRNQPMMWLLAVRKKLMLTLSLSDKFKDVKKLVNYRIYSYIFSTITAIFLITEYTLIAAFTLLSLFFSNDKNNDYFSFGVIEPNAFHKNFIPPSFIISIAGLFNGVELHEILLCTTVALAGLSIHLFHEEFTFSELKSNSIVITFVITLTLLFQYKAPYTEYVAYALLAFLLGISIYFTYRVIKKIIINSISKMEMKSIAKGKLQNREYIYQVLKNKKLTDSDKCKILNYIEDNIPLASGTWPDMSLFNIYNNSTSSVRIFLLEDKWKEQEESNT